MQYLGNGWHFQPEWLPLKQKSPFLRFLGERNTEQCTFGADNVRPDPRILKRCHFPTYIAVGWKLGMFGFSWEKLQIYSPGEIKCLGKFCQRIFTPGIKLSQKSWNFLPCLKWNPGIFSKNNFSNSMTKWYSWNFLVPECSFLQCSVWKFSVPEFCFTENTWIQKRLYQKVW